MKSFVTLFAASLIVILSFKVGAAEVWTASRVLTVLEPVNQLSFAVSKDDSGELLVSLSKSPGEIYMEIKDWPKFISFYNTAKVEYLNLSEEERESLKVGTPTGAIKGKFYSAVGNNVEVSPSNYGIFISFKTNKKFSAGFLVTGTNQESLEKGILKTTALLKEKGWKPAATISPSDLKLPRHGKAWILLEERDDGKCPYCSEPTTP